MLLTLLILQAASFINPLVYKLLNRQALELPHFYYITRKILGYRKISCIAPWGYMFLQPIWGLYSRNLLCGTFQGTISRICGTAVEPLYRRRTRGETGEQERHRGHEIQIIGMLVQFFSCISGVYFIKFRTQISDSDLEQTTNKNAARRLVKSARLSPLIGF